MLKLLETNLDGVGKVFASEEGIVKGDFATLNGEEDLYKISYKDETKLEAKIAKVTKLPKEPVMEGEKGNIVIGNFKYYVKEKTSKNQMVLFDGKYFKILDIIKLSKELKELVLERIFEFELTQVYTIKKIDLNDRNKLGEFNKKEVSYHIDFGKALIKLTHFRSKEQDENIRYTL